MQIHRINTLYLYMGKFVNQTYTFNFLILNCMNSFYKSNLRTNKKLIISTSQHFILWWQVQLNGTLEGKRKLRKRITCQSLVIEMLNNWWCKIIKSTVSQNMTSWMVREAEEKKFEKKKVEKKTLLSYRKSVLPCKFSNYKFLNTT